MSPSPPTGLVTKDLAAHIKNSKFCWNKWDLENILPASRFGETDSVSWLRLSMNDPLTNQSHQSQLLHHELMFSIPISPRKPHLKLYKQIQSVKPKPKEQRSTVDLSLARLERLCSRTCSSTWFVLLLSYLLLFWDRVSLWSPGWSETSSNLPVPASGMLGLQICTTVPSFGHAS